MPGKSFPCIVSSCHDGVKFGLTASGWSSNFLFYLHPVQVQLQALHISIVSWRTGQTWLFWDIAGTQRTSLLALTTSAPPSLHQLQCGIMFLTKTSAPSTGGLTVNTTAANSLLWVCLFRWTYILISNPNVPAYAAYRFLFLCSPYSCIYALSTFVYSMQPLLLHSLSLLLLLFYAQCLGIGGKGRGL